MTIILKSDQTAKNFIGNAYEINGRTDFNVMLDFNRQEYFKYQNTPLKEVMLIDDVLSYSRTGLATYRTKNGEWLLSEANTPRISYDEASGVGGLLLERNASNFFINPEQPVTQTINLPVNYDNYGAAISVYGSGHITVTGDIHSGASVPINQGEPLLTVFKKSATGEIAIQVEVVGSVSYVQVEGVPPTVGAVISTSMMPKQANGQYNRIRDVVTLNTAIAEVVAKSKTIVINYKLHKKAVGVPYTGSAYNKLLELYDASRPMGDFNDISRPAGSLQVMLSTLDHNVGLNSFTIAVNSETEGEPQQTYRMFIPDTRDITIAITHDSKLGGLVYAVNGTSSETSITGFTDFLTGVGFSGYAPSVCGLLTKLVAYEGAFTRSELEEVSKSWM